MSLNIKNEETCRLAAELAKLTGETMTGAITVALRDRLEREKRLRNADELAAKLHEIGQRCAKLHGTGRTVGRRTWRLAVRRTGIAQVIIDTSAIMAILFDEPDAARYEHGDRHGVAQADVRSCAASRRIHGRRGQKRNRGRGITTSTLFVQEGEHRADAGHDGTDRSRAPMPGGGSARATIGRR